MSKQLMIMINSKQLITQSKFEFYEIRDFGKLFGIKKARDDNFF